MRTKSKKSVWTNLLVMVGMLCAATALCLLLDFFDNRGHGDAYCAMLYLLAVLLVSRFTDGYAYGVAASLVSVLAINFFFTYPYNAFNFFLPGYPVAIACMLAVAICTSALITRIKEQERLRLEAEREKTRANLLRAVSHDLRTPLTSIMGASAALKASDELLGHEQRMRLYGEIDDDAQWLLRMVENLLIITRIRQDRAQKLTKSPELIEEVLSEAFRRFQKRFPETPVLVSAPEEPILCPMDAMLIEQVLINLLENVALHAHTKETTVLRAVKRDQTVVFSVSDKGCGVPKEQLKTLFDGGWSALKDNQTDGKRSMGIGLSVCSAIVREHGGRMWAETGENGGLIVSFDLPLSPETNEPSKRIPENA